MADVLTPEQRRHNMRRIKGRDTKPEMLLRRGLHARGFRYRLHVGDLPGKPDLVFPKYQTVIFAHGCFWHGHNCHLFKWPATRREFWKAKIERNQIRDQECLSKLLHLRWRAVTVWECALRGRNRQPLDDVMSAIERFIHSPDQVVCSLSGYK